jgi:hypothetical protein
MPAVWGDPISRTGPSAPTAGRAASQRRAAATERPTRRAGGRSGWVRVGNLMLKSDLPLKRDLMVKSDGDTGSGEGLIRAS